MRTGALVATTLVARINLRKGFRGAMDSLVALEIVSAFVAVLEVMMVMRLAADFSAEMGAAAITTTANPDKAFGVMVMVQFACGAAGLFGLSCIGLKGGFFVLAGLAVSVLLLLPWFPTMVAAPAWDSEVKLSR